MSDFAEVLSQAIAAMRDRGGHCKAEEVVDYAYDLDPDVFERNGTRLIRQQAIAHVRGVMRRSSMTASPDQLLPGLHFPAWIAVTHDDGATTYVPHEKATWSDLEAGEVQREENFRNAEESLNAYRRSMAELRPYMFGEPLMTVSQAVALRDKRRRDVDGDGDFFGFAPA